MQNNTQLELSSSWRKLPAFPFSGMGDTEIGSEATSASCHDMSAEEVAKCVIHASWQLVLRQRHTAITTRRSRPLHQDLGSHALQSLSIMDETVRD